MPSSSLAAGPVRAGLCVTVLRSLRAGVPLGKHDFDQHAGALCLLLAAASRVDPDPAILAAQLLEAAGWRQAGAPLHLTLDPVARRALARLALSLRTH